VTVEDGSDPSDQLPEVGKGKATVPSSYHVRLLPESTAAAVGMEECSDNEGLSRPGPFEDRWREALCDQHVGSWEQLDWSWPRKGWEETDEEARGPGTNSGSAVAAPSGTVGVVEDEPRSRAAQDAVGMSVEGHTTG